MPPLASPSQLVWVGPGRRRRRPRSRSRARPPRRRRRPSRARRHRRARPGPVRAAELVRAGGLRRLLIFSRSFPAFGSTAVVVVSKADRLPDAVLAVQCVVDGSTWPARDFATTPSCRRSTAPPAGPSRVSPLMMEAVWRASGRPLTTATSTRLSALRWSRSAMTATSRRGLKAADAARCEGRVGPGTADDSRRPGGPNGERGRAWRSTRRDRQGARCRPRGARGVRRGRSATCSSASAVIWLSPAPHRRRLADPRHRRPPRLLHAPGQSITIANGGLATSSTPTARRWRSAGAERRSSSRPGDGSSGRGGLADRQRRPLQAASTPTSPAPPRLFAGARAPAWLAAQELPSGLVTDDGRSLHVAGGLPTAMTWRRSLRRLATVEARA